MCAICKLRKGKLSVSFSEAVWFIEHQWELGPICFECEQFLKGILETKLKEEGIGQADFGSVRKTDQ